VCAVIARRSKRLEAAINKLHNESKANGQVVDIDLNNTTNIGQQNGSIACHVTHSSLGELSSEKDDGDQQLLDESLRRRLPTGINDE
jgi:hypothetical protein